MTKIIGVINNKGGVGKSETVKQLAYTLATVHNKKILVLDTDKQGNTSKFFYMHASVFLNDEKGLQDLYLDSNLKAKDVIQNTLYENVDIITANMKLANAEKDILLDEEREQQYILKEILEPIKENYDYIIIDFPPDLTGILVTNALCITDDVIVPLKIDKHAIDGLVQVLDHIEVIKEDFNPNIEFKGCLVTMYRKNKVNKQGVEYLKGQYPCFETVIRDTTNVPTASFVEKPLLLFNKRGTATMDYVAVTEEYINGVI